MPATIVDDFRAATSDLDQAAICSDSGCSLSLVGVPEPYVLLQIDNANNQPPEVSGQPRCDYLFVGGDDTKDGLWIVPIELTIGHSKTVRHILAQLNGGLAVAEARLRPVKRLRLCPVVAHGPGGLGRYVSSRLKNQANQVHFRGKSKPVQTVCCGSKLADALALS